MTASTGARVVVVGVGNPWRRDDGIGPAVATALLARLDPGNRDVAVLVLDGEAARLVEAWDGADLAVVVDAVRTGAIPGTVHRFDVTGGDDRGGHLGTIAAGGGTSSHGVGLAQAVALAQALDRMPRELVVVGVEGADFTAGTELSVPVAAAVEPAARLIDSLTRDTLGPEPVARTPAPAAPGVAAGRLVTEPGEVRGRCA
jgi:hydrogenase maturation protease